MTRATAFAVLALLALAQGSNLRAAAGALDPAKEQAVDDNVNSFLSKWKASVESIQADLPTAKASFEEHTSAKAEKDAAIRALKEELADVDRQHAEAKAATNAVRQQREALHADTEELSKLEEEQRAMLQKLIEAKKEEQKVAADVKHAKQQLAEAAANEDDVMKKVEGGDCGVTPAKLQEMQGQAQKKREKRVSVQKELEEERADYEKLVADNAELQAKIEAGETSLSETNLKLSQAEDFMAQLEEQTKKLEFAIDAREKMVKKAKDAAEEHRNEALALQKESGIEPTFLLQTTAPNELILCGDMNTPARFPAVAKVLCDSDFHLKSVNLDALESEVTSAKASVDALNELHTKLSTAMNAATKQLDAMKTEVASLGSSAAQSEADVQKIRAMIQKEAETRQNLLDAMKAVEIQRAQEAATLRNNIDTLIANEREIRTNLEAAREKLSLLRNDLLVRVEELETALLKSKCDALKIELESTKEELSELDRDIAGVRAELSLVGEKTADARDESTKLEDKEAKVTEDLAKATADLTEQEAKEAKVAELTQKNEALKVSVSKARAEQDKEAAKVRALQDGMLVF